jgi:radical SAM protein with 4Fe4S-binding SPASM domain
MLKSKYSELTKVRVMPRLPLTGNLDLTYRCNNHCLHCWLWRPGNAREQSEELSFDEIRRIADEARAMGTREWGISGGEPMLRPDFPEIFDYLTRKAAAYTLNTNGTLITPEIARMLTRKGVKLVALYGATAEVYDRVTRNPGSFEQVMAGFAYLKEAGAGFVVQLIPMRDNWHQWAEMVDLAKSLSPGWRVGAPWLFFSADGDPVRNAEIARQRLDPADVIEVDTPDLCYEERDRALQSPGKREERGGTGVHECRRLPYDDRLFGTCISVARKFHVDAYGGMTSCIFIKDPSLRYDLRRGTLREAWEVFIPSLAERVRGGPAYRENCAKCSLRAECGWCSVYSYLEHRDLSAKVDYMCAIAQEKRRYKERWQAEHRRYYRIAGTTIQLDSDLPFTAETFDPKLGAFRAAGPGEDMVTINHHFSLEGLHLEDMGKEVYRKDFWTIHRMGDTWIYINTGGAPDAPALHRVAIFSHNHAYACIYHIDEEAWWDGGLTSLTLFPTDQILIARLLADRQGCCLHSAGVILDGKGLLFVGQSEDGKTTMARLLQDHAEILCDDRNIARRVNGRFHVYGTWSHGELPIVSPSSAPLHAIFFIRKSAENRLTRLEDLKEIMRRLLPRVIKPLITADWWEKTLDVVEALAREVPCYQMDFDTSGNIVKLLRDV